MWLLGVINELLFSIPGDPKKSPGISQLVLCVFRKKLNIMVKINKAHMINKQNKKINFLHLSHHLQCLAWTTERQERQL